MVARGKKTANQHDKRHENGLAAPGKRVTRQKSNPLLQPAANGHVGPSTPPPPPASHVDNDDDTHQDTTQPPAAAAAASSSSFSDPALGLSASAMATTMTTAATTTTTTTASAQLSAGDGRARAGSDASLDDNNSSNNNNNNNNTTNTPVDACRSFPTGSFDSPAAPSLRRVNSKSASLSMASLLSVPATILTSCPLRDVLAILILLLQLPPTVLTVVQFLFATLTFVPPQAGTPLSALSAFPSFTDIFQGSGGTPSLFTTIFADASILIVWLLLWVPVQNFLLDLAQAVIAIALGGAAAGKNGTTNGIFICFVIILSNHLFRFRPLRQHIVHLLWTGLARGGLEFLTSPPSAPTYLESFSSPHGWPRSLLGIHILAQGIVRIIRRSLSRREVTQSLPTGKKTDPEAGGLQRANSTSLDPISDVPNASSTDGRPPGPSPAAHMKTDKASSSRRKRKQATHVRSQQPFWAALASTKVTVLKEMESSRAANDADEANAKDANHIGNAVWRSEDDRVWISEVGFSDISFCVSLLNGTDFQEEEDAGVGPGIDKSKPFYIRVNGADWSSTRIRQSAPLGYQGQEGTNSWMGEIFGLTALSNYYCEFVRTADNEVFYSASLVTSASPVAELAYVASPSTHQTLRPSSPTTTLKNSIAAADQQLQEQRNRLKRNKKDHKAAITTIKKEVDTLISRLANAGGSDERQRQRVLQFTQNIRQADDAAAEFALQVENMGGIPEDEAEEAAAKKAEWKKERNKKNAVSAEFEDVKADIERQVQSVESDISAVLQKRERLQQRQTRLNEQHDRLVTANQEGFTAKQRREQERAALRQQRAEIESQYRNNINGYEHRAEENAMATAQIMHTIEHYESLLHQQQQHQQRESVPTTPEGPLPGTSMSPHANAFTSFTFPSLNSHLDSTPGSLPGGRGRSSSMLSNVSGFTDGFDDPYLSSGYVLGNPFNTPGQTNGCNGSRGSGSLSSGTSSQSSSNKDPMSPFQTFKPMMVRSPTGGSGGLMSPIGSGRQT